MENIIPVLETPLDIQRLASTLSTENPVIALWAAQYPRSSLDVMLELYELLCARNKQVILLLRQGCVIPFLSLKKITGEHIYVFNNTPLLEYCHFIDLLISHDYCVGFSGAPAEFKGKILIFQHNMSLTSPFFTNYWADYLLTSNNILLPSTQSWDDFTLTPKPSVTPDFDYNRIPNHLKIAALPTCTLIPCGYPKLDLLIKERERWIGLQKLVAFYPTTFGYVIPGASENSILSRWCELIKLFFETYPNWRFVFRPDTPNRNHNIVKNICKEFNHYSGFIFDDGDDNKRYLIEADYLITEKSSVGFNFSFATLRPTISLGEGACQSTLTRKGIGYLVSSAKQAVQAIADALESQPDWGKKILEYRNAYMLNAGKSCTYLADNIDLCIQGKKHEDWITFDKGDTPFDKICYWLKLWNRLLDSCSKEEEVACYQVPPGTLYLKSIEMHGNNVKIALAFLRFTVRLLPYWATKIDAFRGAFKLMGSVDSVFKILPSSHIFGLLRHIVKKDPENMYALLWLMEATARWGNKVSTEPLLALVMRLQGKHLPSQLATFALQRLYPVVQKLCIATNDWKALLIFLEASLGKDASSVSSQITFDYILLLIKYQRFDDAKIIFDQWIQLKDDTKGIAKDYYAVIKIFVEKEGHSPLPDVYCKKGTLAHIWIEELQSKTYKRILEKYIVKMLVSKKKYQKYVRDRDTFFNESSIFEKHIMKILLSEKKYCKYIKNRKKFFAESKWTFIKAYAR